MAGCRRGREDVATVFDSAVACAEEAESGLCEQLQWQMTSIAMASGLSLSTVVWQQHAPLGPHPLLLFLLTLPPDEFESTWRISTLCLSFFSVSEPSDVRGSTSFMKMPVSDWPTKGFSEDAEERMLESQPAVKLSSHVT